MMEIEYLARGKDKHPYILDDIAPFEKGFAYLKSKTGVVIDPYGNTRLYPDHQRLLLAYWKDDDRPEVRRFASYLATAASRDVILFFSGD